MQLDQNVRSDVAKDLADIRAKMAELSERKVTASRSAAADRHPRAASRLRAPARCAHQGEVVGAGEAIMLIVPSADALIVEVKVAPYDIDQVLVNQPATLRFPTFNQHVTPELSAALCGASLPTS